MKPQIISCLLFTIFLIGNITPSFSQSPEQLFQNGLIKEEGEGDLNEAIDIYNKIVNDQDADKSLRAKALLHVGVCYEKLGKNEAAKTYLQLINNFPAQKSEVAIARERLARLKLEVKKLSITPLKPKFSKVKIPTELSWSVKLSPDGKNLALISDKKLWIMPLSGNLGQEYPGTPVQLSTEGLEVEWTGLSWSGDGKWIAFNEYPRRDERGDIIGNQRIYVIPSGGGKPTKIIENYRDARVVNYRLGLSPDGKNLAFSSVENNQQHIYIIPVDGGSPRRLTDAQAREPVYSPDGKMIAFVADKNLGRGEGGLGLWVVSPQGGTPHLVAEAGKASSPVWSPDSRMIAYLDYSNNKQIFVVPINESGEANGEATVIDTPEGTNGIRLLAGWTPDNKIGALLTSEQEFSLYTLPATGGQSAIILNDVHALQPRWSSDGKRIYYITPPAEGDQRMYRLGLAMVSSKGGTGKPLPVFSNKLPLNQMAFQAGNRVSPDGKMIISAAWTTEGGSAESGFPRAKIWKIAIDGSEAAQLTHKEGPFADGSPCWSPDGKKVAFVRVGLKDEGMVPYGDAAIYVVDASGGEPEFLVSQSGKYVNSLIWSPDGKMLAWLSQEQEASQSKPKVLNIFDLSDKKTRIAGEVPTQHVNIETAWSPDSRRIAFNDDAGKVIKVMNLDDGSIEDIETGLVDISIYHLDWSPDGQKFVFAGIKGGNKEFWFLENFLPPEELPMKSEVQVKSPRLFTDKKIWEDQDIDDSGEISPDGKFLSYIDWNTGELGVYEIATGEKRRLTYTNTSANYDEFAFSPKWMPDGKHIVYTAFVSRELSELRIIGPDNPAPRTVYSLRGKEKWLEVHDVSKNGYTVLTTVEIEGDTTQIALLSVPDGKLRIIKKLLSPSSPEKLIFTGDEKGIIYDFPADPDSHNHDIYWLSVDGRTQKALVEHPAHDYLLGLSPDGEKLLFASSRSGKLGFWYIGLEDGKTIGDPQYIKASEYAYLKGLGFSEKGAFFYCHFPSKTDVFEIEINPETGQIVRPPYELVHNFLGENSSPDYSSDGKYLAFVSRRSPFNARETFIPRGNVLCIKSLENGDLQEIKPDISNFGFPKWSPDNQSILVVNWGANNRMGIYNIEVRTGKSTRIVMEAYQRLSHHDWSADGKSVYLVRNDENGNTKLVRLFPETGKEKVMVTGTWKELYNISRSADGKWIAFMGLDKQRSLKVISANGGESREIYTWYQGDKRAIWYCWSPDGKYIYLQKLREPKSDLIWNLWQIPVEGGKAKNLGLEMTELWQIRAHPDGRHLAFSNQGETYKSSQVWMMEYFLPMTEKEDNQN